MQKQDPKPVLQPTLPSTSLTKPETGTSESVAANSASKPAPVANESSEKKVESSAAQAKIYSATAYSLRGRTASGRPASRGMIAADPRVLPLGTRVRIEAGEFSGEYVVADTGGAVKGRRVDIWTPTPREAMRFGRRAVRLTVLEFGGNKRKNASTQARSVTQVSTASTTEQTGKQQK